MSKIPTTCSSPSIPAAASPTSAQAKHLGYDPEEVSGLAFGLGIERVCARRHGVTDIREFYKNDVRFLHQF